MQQLFSFAGRPHGSKQKQSQPAVQKNTRNSRSNVQKGTVDTSKAQPIKPTDNNLDPKLQKALDDLNAKFDATQTHSPSSSRTSSAPPSTVGSTTSTNISNSQFSQLSDAITEVNKKQTEMKEIVQTSKDQEIEGLRKQVAALLAEKSSMVREIGHLEGANINLAQDRDRWQQMSMTVLNSFSNSTEAATTTKKKSKH